MSHPDPFDQAAQKALAYLTFRRGLRRLREAEDIIREAIALLERGDHPLGPVNAPPPAVTTETTAENLGFTPEQVRELEKRLGESA